MYNFAPSDTMLTLPVSEYESTYSTSLADASFVKNTEVDSLKASVQSDTM